MAHRNCLYLRVTNDKYELPVAVADTVIELAESKGSSQPTESAPEDGFINVPEGIENDLPFK